MAETLLKLNPQTQVCKCCGRELPLDNFRVSRLGRLHTCMDCTRQNQVKARLDKKLAEENKKKAIDARVLRLCDFSPRELMAELKRRGYKFKMEYTETHIIDSKDIEI